MTNVSQKVVAIFSGIIILFLIVIIIRINKTNYDLHQKIIAIENRINALNNSISSLDSSFTWQLNQIKEQAEENKRIYYGNDFEIINYNQLNDIATINYYLKLKEYSPDDKVFLVYKTGNTSEKVEMENNNSIFNVNIDIIADSKYNITVVVEGDTIITQDLGQVSVYETMRQRFQLYYNFYPKIDYDIRDNKFYVSFDFNLSNDYRSNPKLKLVSGKIFASYDSNVIVNIPNILSITTDTNQVQSISMKKEALVSNLNEETEKIIENIVIYEIELKDSYGFTYKWEYHNQAKS